MLVNSAGTELTPEAPAGLQEGLVNDEEGDHGRPGAKPSLAERNRERQQRFRQRQKSRIEELDQRCARLTQQNRALQDEKEGLIKNINFWKEVVQSREVQLVAVTTRLAQLLPQHEKEGEGLLDITSVDALLRQHAFTEALQTSINPPQDDGTQSLSKQIPQSDPERVAEGQVQEQSSSQGKNRTNLSDLEALQPKSQPIALDQLCRVAEMAEIQRGDGSEAQPGQTDTEEARIDSGNEELHVPNFCFTSKEFARCTDVAIYLEGQRILLHSSVLAANSNYYAKKFVELRHSQPLFLSNKEPILVDTASPGKRLQDVQVFLQHCYRSLDIRSVANTDLMRLIMLAHEFESKLLLEECDQLLVDRSERKPFSFFVELTNGGDMVDWIRLSDQLGLKKAGSICEMHLARHLKENPHGQESARMQGLGQECLLRVINKLAQL